MDNKAIVLAGIASIDSAYTVQSISSLVYRCAFNYATLTLNKFRFIPPRIPPKILEYWRRLLRTCAEEYYQDVGKKKIDDLIKQEKRKRQQEEEAIKDVDEKTEEKKEIGKTEEERTRLEEEARTPAKKDTRWFWDKLLEVVEKASEELAKELEAADLDCNAEKCTDVLIYQVANAIAEIIVEEMTDVITRVSVEGTELMYKAKLGSYDPQNVTYVNVTFKELGVFPILERFQHDVKSSFMAFSLAFFHTEGKIRDGKQMRSPFDDIGPEMIVKMSNLNAWLKNHENDRVQVDKSVSDTFCLIMEYIMQPFIAGMGTLGRLSTEVTERWMKPPNFQCTVTQLNSITRNLLKLMSTFELLEKLVSNMQGLENTLPSSVDVKGWKARLEHIT